MNTLCTFAAQCFWLHAAHRHERAVCTWCKNPALFLHAKMHCHEATLKKSSFFTIFVTNLTSGAYTYCIRYPYPTIYPIPYTHTQVARCIYARRIRSPLLVNLFYQRQRAFSQHACSTIGLICGMFLAGGI